MATIRLGGPDTGSIRFLQNWPGGMFISPLVDNSDQRIHQFLVERFFANGSLLFGTESSVLNDFRDVCGGSLDGETNQVVYAIAQYFVQRIHNFRHVESIAMAEIIQARVPPADYLTPTTCIGHAGRMVNVIDASKRIRWMKTLTAEDYGILAYAVDFGFPPFDILCSCRIEGIIPGVDYDVEEPKRRPTVTRTKWDRLNHIHQIFSKRSPPEMSEEKFSELLEFMLRVSDELSANPDPQSKLERLIGEALAARGISDEAIAHLEKALSIRPKVGVKKLLSELKSRR
jgi:hypothetical protein